jgi:MFS family permease
MVNKTLEDQFNFLNASSLVNIILVCNAFVWYFFAITILKGATANFQSNSTVLQIWIVHFSSIGISAIIGAALTSRLHNRVKFLIFWMILGILSSSVTILLDLAYLPNVLLIASLLGFSLGIGMPCCMGYFTESIKIESRGRVGGVIMLLSGLGIVILGMVPEGNSSFQGLILTVWRIIGLLFFLLLQSNVKNLAKGVAPSYRSLSNSPFLLYLIPWIMFSLIAYLTIPIQSKYIGNAEINYLTMLNNVFIGIFAIVGGFLIDAVGRKRMSIIGFSLMGTAYAILGLFYETSSSWYFYTIINGIAWGIFYVIFVVTIWGDLSPGKSSDMYYAVGVLPFFVSNFIQLTIGNNLGDLIPTADIFTFSAFFLFLAVLPLVYAPETLPEKIMKERELKSYVEKALKKVQKETGKSQRKDSGEAEKENKDGEEAEEIPEYEEARKLAEKYY